MEDILAHYGNVLGRQGLSIVPIHNTTTTVWRAGERGMKGLSEVSIGRDFLLVGRTELTTEDLTKWAPAMLEGCPTNLVAFVLHGRFVSNETAAAYWTAEQQARRKALLAKEGM